FWVAPLHDIGKVGIPEAILRKQDRLTADEFEIIKTHSVLGWQAMQDAEKRLGMQADFLAIAKDVTLHHHERWDGGGYPAGLAGEDIPVAARLMAVADVYDALVSWRPYRQPLSHEDALRIMRDGKGKHFDPDILDAFVENHEEFQMIAERYADTAAGLRTPAAHQIRQAPSSETMHGPTGLRGVQAEP
ncbi:MAG: HD-GYP domain-containing protein, partial [Candidatus Methylumidiphilus sp.]